MRKRFYIYEVLGWPIDATVLKAPYHVDIAVGYDTIEEAEKQLDEQESDGNLQGQFMILPVYFLEMD